VTRFDIILVLMLDNTGNLAGASHSRQAEHTPATQSLGGQSGQLCVTSRIDAQLQYYFHKLTGSYV
jgi:hypothetical protein